MPAVLAGIRPVLPKRRTSPRSPAGRFTSAPAAYHRRTHPRRANHHDAAGPRPSLSRGDQHLLREDRQFAGLAAELERARGSVLSPSEQEILAYLFGSLELSPDYLLVAAAYCRDKGKKKLSYLEKMIAGWLEQGIDSYEKAECHIRRLVRQEDHESHIRRLFGLPERALTAREKACVTRWFEEYMTPEELIRLAYDRTVEATGKVSFAYIDKILAAWAAKGITTVQAAVADRNAAVRAAEGDYSFDLSEAMRIMEQNSNG